MLDEATSLAPGEVVWDRSGRIVSVRRPRGRVRDCVILPGLVNSHAHLQIAPLASGSRSFLPWVGQVMAARVGATPASLQRQALEAVRLLAAEGVTAIGEIDASGASDPLFARLGLPGRCYQEVTGYHLDRVGAVALVRERQGRASDRHRTGISPHAPYSVSAELFAAAARRARHLAVHCAELPEEQQFLRTGRGPFAELLTRLGRLPSDHRPPGVGAVAWLERLGILRPSTLLVHCQELEPGDLARIRAAGAPVVVCPGTIRYFGRTPPPVPRWLAAGVPVALGTDSAASCATFSLRRDLELAAGMWPELPPAQLFAMATRAGARALGCRGLGALRRGGRADFVEVRVDAGSLADVLAAFVHGTARVERVVRAGRTVPVVGVPRVAGRGSGA